MYNIYIYITELIAQSMMSFQPWLKMLFLSSTSTSKKCHSSLKKRRVLQFYSWLWRSRKAGRSVRFQEEEEIHEPCLGDSWTKINFIYFNINHSRFCIHILFSYLVYFLYDIVLIHIVRMIVSTNKLHSENDHDILWNDSPSPLQPATFGGTNSQKDWCAATVTVVRSSLLAIWEKHCSWPVLEEFFLRRKKQTGVDPLESICCITICWCLLMILDDFGWFLIIHVVQQLMIFGWFLDDF